MKLSLNHVAIGTRFSGSLVGDQATTWEFLEELPEFGSWLETAKVGDTFDVPCHGGVYVAVVAA